MVNVHRENNSQVVNVVPVDNTQIVKGTNDKTKYYSDLAKHYAELAEDYADNADTSAYNALISATSADNSAGICTRVLENEHFQTVYTDLESENSNIEAVGNNIENVNDVAENLSDINSIVTNLNDINNVASDLTNIDNVASNISSVNSVANDLTNIDTVKDNLTDIGTVANNISDVNDIADNLSTIQAVNNNATSINAVNSNKTNIDAVAGNVTNINVVAGNATNINAVANNETNINAVVSNATNINAIAGDLTNINAVANDLTNIDNASTYAASSKQYAVGLPTEPAEGSAKYWAGQAAARQVQTDWNETDNTEIDYIKNKPTALSSFTDDLGTNPVHTHSQYLTSHQDLSGLANTDLSNLSATGEAKFANTTLSNTVSLSNSFANLLSQWLTLSGQTTVYNSFVEALNNANIRTIKDIYVNGTSGYIIFSNDFCVQWGFTDTAFSTTTVSFLKNMQNTNYLVLIGGISAYTIPRVTKDTLTTNSMGLNRQGNTNARGWWCIAGYANLSITTYNVYLGVNTSNTNYTNNGNYRITASGQGSSFSRDNTYTLNTPVTNCTGIQFYYKDSHSTGHNVTTRVYVVTSANTEIEVYSRTANWNVAQTAVSYSLSNITVKAIRIYTSVGVDVNSYHNSTTTIEGIQLIK